MKTKADLGHTVVKSVNEAIENAIKTECDRIFEGYKKDLIRDLEDQKIEILARVAIRIRECYKPNELATEIIVRLT